MPHVGNFSGAYHLFETVFEIVSISSVYHRKCKEHFFVATCQYTTIFNANH